MENDSDVEQTLRETARAEAAPWTDYPRTPAWLPPAVGLWSAGFVLTSAGLDDHHLVQALCYLALVLATMVFVRWYRRYRGTMPDLRSVPAEFRRALVGYVVGVVLAVVSVSAVTAWLGAWAGALFALVVVTAGFTAHERAYAAAARRTKRGLA